MPFLETVLTLSFLLVHRLAGLSVCRVLMRCRLGRIWNEHSYDIDWIIKLREALDAEPDAADVTIVASDQGGWPICADMVKNDTLRDAVGIIGSHYPVS